MIITSAGAGFEAPVDANFRIRFASPFTLLELSTATLTVECSGPGGLFVVQSALSDGTDVVLLVIPNMFSVGLWELNPVAVISGSRYSCAEAHAMNVLARGVSRYPKRFSGRSQIQ